LLQVVRVQFELVCDVFDQKRRLQLHYYERVCNY
jgi:hypothetical protein